MQISGIFVESCVKNEKNVDFLLGVYEDEKFQHLLSRVLRG